MTEPPGSSIVEGPGGFHRPWSLGGGTRKDPHPMKKTASIIAVSILTLVLVSCGDSAQTSETTESSTSSSASTTEKMSVELSTSTDLIPETVQQQIEEAAAKGRGPRPPLSEMILVDSFGYVGIYITDDGMEHYLCDARGYASMDVMGDDGCTQPMGWDEARSAFEASLNRAFEREGLEIPEQSAGTAEGDATTRFWECMDAGGTEEACRQ